MIIVLTDYGLCYLRNFDNYDDIKDNLYNVLHMLPTIDASSFNNILTSEDGSETILYNVPDLFFENYSLDNLMKIMNYIRNSNILNYQTIDEQDFALVTSY